jgi:predicted ester cyclase
LSEFQKKTIVRWFEEIWNRGNAEVIDELLPATTVLHDGAVDMHGPNDFRKFYETMRATFSAVRVEPNQIISEGEYTCLRWTATLQHAATGASVQTTGISIIQFRNERFFEAWQSWDQHGLRQQIEEAVRTAALSPAASA